MNTGHAAPRVVAPLSRLHPRIVLEHCHLCAGTGHYLTWRNGRPAQEVCTNCAGRGTIVRDAA